MDVSDLQFICARASALGSRSAVGNVACRRPRSPAPTPPPNVGSGLTLGLRPLVGLTGSGTRAGSGYTVTSPASSPPSSPAASGPSSSSSSYALWYSGLGSLLRSGEGCWCLNQPEPALRQAGGEKERRELAEATESLTLLRKPECWDGSSGRVGEKSPRASKSSIEAQMLGCESAAAAGVVAVAGREVMAVGRIMRLRMEREPDGEGARG